MNPLQERLANLNAGLLSNLQETVLEVKLLLETYSRNFPTYTDHSFNHTNEVFKIAADLLTIEEIHNLNADEIYVLSMACLLHDIGMCLPKENIEQIAKTSKYLDCVEVNPNMNLENYIRDIHHELSYEFIIREKELLKIPNDDYAEAIALVARGHRKVALDDIKIYKPKFFIKSGREFVCLPYLACILRLADELDITNIRTPKLLTKYYMPNNETSILEWEKHIATTKINFTEDKVIFNVKCSDQNNLAALEEQFEKIQNVVNYCQKTIRTISNTENRRFKLNLIKIEPEFSYIGFDPKGIKFSFNVQNVVNTFIGEDLYVEKLTSIREALQNSIDSCRYKKSILNHDYSADIKVTVDELFILIEDNGLGMDEFIIENFFGRLGSSFYEQEKVKKDFEAIGQFGVGVFSYFLLSEYIDIDTKMENEPSLKFRIDKDPKNYFHFYDKSDRAIAGTSIKLYLRKELIGKYSCKEIESYISEIFRYIEIPIKIRENGNEIIKESDPIRINFENELLKILKVQYKNNISNFQCVEYYINNDEFEGHCCLILNKFKSNYRLSDISHYFDYESFKNVEFSQDYAIVSLCQKGVFVNNYGCDYLKFVIGNINIKKSIKINISRNEFSDIKAIKNVVDTFTVGLIKSLFTEFQKKYNSRIVLLTNEFLSNYFYFFYNSDKSNKEITNIISENLYFEVYNDKESKTLNLNNIKKDIEQFILISDIENKSDIYNKLKLPIISAKGYEYSGSFKNMKTIFINNLNYVPSIIMSDNCAFQKFTNKSNLDYQNNRKIYKKVSKYYSVSEEIASNLISVCYTSNKKGFENYASFRDCIVNTCHPFFIFCKNNIDQITNNSDYIKITQAAFENISKITENKKCVSNKDIKELNMIIEPLNQIDKIPQFSISDFQFKFPIAKKVKSKI